jgi:hypothetical protein
VRFPPLVVWQLAREPSAVRRSGRSQELRLTGCQCRQQQLPLSPAPAKVSGSDAGANWTEHWDVVVRILWYCASGSALLKECQGPNLTR